VNAAQRSTVRIGSIALLGLALAAGGCNSTGGTGRTPTRPVNVASGDLTKARAITAQADEAFKRGEFEKADKLYRESLAIFPNQTGAWNNLGNALMAQKNYVDAQAAFRRAIDLEPGRPEPYTSLGRLWLEAKYAQDSIEHFDKALAIDGRWLPALRGKSAASHSLALATPEYADMLRTALLIESDPEWRRFFDRERSRVEQALSFGG